MADDGVSRLLNPWGGVFRGTPWLPLGHPINLHQTRATSILALEVGVKY